MIGKRLAGKFHELGTEDLGECPHGNEESLSRSKPRTSVIGEPAAGNKTVDVGVIEHGPGPGMEHTEHGDGATDMAAVSGEAHEGRGGRPDENGVEDSLMGAEGPMELFGHGKDEVKVGNRKKLPPSLIEPLVGMAPVALGTASVSAGMVGVPPLAAVVADGKMAAEGLGTALGQVPERTLMAGKHPRAEALSVLGAVASKNVSNLRHDLLWMLLQVSMRSLMISWKFVMVFRVR